MNRFAALLLSAVFLAIGGLTAPEAIGQPEKRPEPSLPAIDWSRVGLKVSAELCKRDLLNWSEDLAGKVTGADVETLQVAVEVFRRAGQPERLSQAIRALRRSSAAGRPGGDWELVTRLLDLGWHEQVRAWFDTFPSLCSGEMRGFMKWLIEKEGAARAEDWLRAKADTEAVRRGLQGGNWTRLYWDQLADAGKLEGYVKGLEAKIKQTPADAGLVFKYVGVRFHFPDAQRLPLTWLAETCRLESALHNFALGQMFQGSDSPEVAIKFYDRSLACPLTDYDRRHFNEFSEWQMYVAPEEAEKHLRRAAKTGLAEACFKAKQLKRAQKLVEELTGKKDGTLEDLGPFQFAGQVQAASGQRVVEGRIKEAEEENKDSILYWLNRAEYYCGRKELRQAEEAYRSALKLPAAATNAWHFDAVRDYGCFLVGQKRLEEADRVFRDELKRIGPKDGNAGFWLNELRHQVDGNGGPPLKWDESIVWDYLAGQRDTFGSDAEWLFQWAAGKAAKEGAAQEFEKKARALVAEPCPLRLQFFFGGFLRGRGITQEGTRIMAEAYKQSPRTEWPGDPRAAEAMLQVHLADKDLAGAGKMLDRLLEESSYGGNSHWLGETAVSAANSRAPELAMRLWRVKAGLDLTDQTELEPLAAQEGLAKPLRAFYSGLAKRAPGNAYVAAALKKLGSEPLPAKGAQSLTAAQAEAAHALSVTGTSAAPAAGTRTSFKGWDLYVWRDKSSTFYALLPGTNRLKTPDEIAVAAVKDLGAIKRQLDEIKAGEFVSVMGQTRDNNPPAEQADAVAEYCRKIGLKVQGWPDRRDAEPAATADPTATQPTTTVRQRLQRAIDASRKLAGKGQEIKDNLGLEACEATDRNKPWRFPRTEDVAAYELARPWASKCAPNMALLRPTRVNAEAVVDWPEQADAPELRKLLEDKDPAMRCVAAEALATLHQFEDIERIGRLLKDEADGLPSLGWNWLLTARIVQEQEIVADGLHRLRGWYDRTVATTARLALKLMTGADLTAGDFDKWWQRNSGGRNCVWYWQQRLTRKMAAAEATEFPPWQGNTVETYEVWCNRCLAQQRERFDAVRQAVAGELARLPAEIEAKVRLAAVNRYSTSLGVSLDEPLMGPYVCPRIGADRLLELLERKNLWEDVDWSNNGYYNNLVVQVVGRAELFFKAEHLARLRAIMDREYGGAWWSGKAAFVVGISHLLPPARPAELDDPKTRDGWLRSRMQSEGDLFARGAVATELIRVGLPENREFINTEFFAETGRKSGSPDVRQAMLQALGQPPLTAAKRTLLVEIVMDERFAPLWTLASSHMGDDMYRQYAIWAVNAHAGKELLTDQDKYALPDPAKSEKALVEVLRKVATLRGDQKK